MTCKCIERETERDRERERERQRERERESEGGRVLAAQQHPSLCVPPGLSPGVAVSYLKWLGQAK